MVTREGEKIINENVLKENMFQPVIQNDIERLVSALPYHTGYWHEDNELAS